MTRILITIVTLASVSLALLPPRGDAGGAKAGPWKQFLSAEDYKALTERSIKVIETAAKSGGKDAHETIELEAAVLAGYTLSAKNPTDDAVATLRGAALQASEAVHKKDFKKLGEFSKLIEKAPKAPAEVKDWKPYLHELEDIMMMFKSKSKGGYGLHADLQYHPKLKNLNSIEALIGALGSKKLSDDNLAKVAGELPLLAARIAVAGSLTYEFRPEKDDAKWREYADQLRDGSIALAQAARTKDGAGILKAAATLDNACTQCHRDYKK